MIELLKDKTIEFNFIAKVLKITMDPSWIEFQSENDLIDIVPNFTAPTLSLLQCDVGPFKAGQPLSVPFWLGSSLRKRQKCRIIQPNWMSVDTLEEVKEAEKQSAIFTELPDPHMFVKAQLITDVGNDDLTRTDEVRTAIKGDLFLLWHRQS